MSGNIPVQEGSAPKSANVALCLGLGSIAALLLSILGGLMIDSVGVITLFRSYVTPLSLAAIAAGFLARRKIREEGLEGYRKARILGVISLSLVVLSILVALIFSFALLFPS